MTLNTTNIEQKANNDAIQVGYAENVNFNGQKQPNFNEVIGAFLQKELKNDKAARLESAGQDFEHQISLASVFVDLPATDSADRANTPQESSEDNEGIVEILLKIGSNILRNKTSEESCGSPSDDADKVFPRVAIVGGPGQGKSTLGQFLCQLYRAAWLKSFLMNRLEPEIIKIIELLEHKQLPTNQRIPIQIVLNEYASDLAKDENLNLLQYIKKKISQLGNTELSLEILKQWLGEYSWLVIFDGLDEVPASSNRAQVLKQIEDFRIDAATVNADMQIIATTRPQSYSNEFVKDFYKHWYLTPLSSKQALDYGRKLIETRCGDNEQRRSKLLRRLEKACETEATAKLMQSPLQVTIMTTLVEVVGEPPKQRYQLFKEYYQAIYNRERGREGALSAILSKHKTDIDNIHYTTGLLLQTQSETIDNTEAKLADEEFRNLVEARLLEDGHPRNKIDRLLYQITDGSLLRLVFLVRPVDGQIAFEIRSLQEFMAAEALLNGRENDVIERLNAIASIGHWRNVFLFAVGKCFVEKDYLLDNIYTLCKKLNDKKTDGIAGNTLWGSRLALDILVEGIAIQKPKYERLFVEIALQLLTLPDTSANIRLALVYHGDLVDLFRDAIKERFAHSNTNQHHGAWALLKTLADHDVSWALELLNKEWPTDYEKQRQILEFNSDQVPCSWAIEKIVDVIPHCKPSSVIYSLVEQVERAKIDDIYLPDWMKAVKYIRGGKERLEISISYDNSKILRLELTSVTNKELIPLKNMPQDSHQDWLPYIATARFAESPTHLILAQELRWLSENWEPKGVPNEFAWPLAACLSEAKTKEDLLQFAELAEKSQLGTLEQWIAAEERWKSKGVVSADFQKMTDDRWPFDAKIADSGFPFECCNIKSNFLFRFLTFFRPKDTGIDEKTWQYLLKQYRELKTNKIKSWIAQEIVRSNFNKKLSFFEKLSFFRKSNELLSITPCQLREIIVSASQNSKRFNLDFVNAIKFPETLDEEWIEFFNWFGQQEYNFIVSDKLWPNSEQLTNWFSTQPDKRLGLLNVLGVLAAGGNKCPVPKNLLQLERYENKGHQFSAAVVRLSQGDWDNKEADKLAQFIANCPRKNRRSAVDSSLDVLKNQKIDSERRDMFTLALWNKLAESTEDRNKEMQSVLDFMTKAMNEKVSGLGKPEIWQKLKLPETKVK
jgi:hypothetical protein